MKTYLHQREQRCGRPIIHFVDHDDKGGYWLGTYYKLEDFGYKKPHPYRGVCSEYNAVSRTRISQNLYEIFIGEAAFNRLNNLKKK